MNEVFLDFSLTTTCPHCAEDIDVADIYSRYDYRIIRKIFTDDWDSIEGAEVMCPHCGEEF